MNPALLALLILLGALAARPAAADGLAYAPLWTTAQNLGTNAVAHAEDRVYVASGTTLTALHMKTGLPVSQVTVDGVRFAAITGVAARGDLVAVALASAVPTDPGRVRLYNAPDGAPELEPVAEFIVGVGPDMLAFTPDGSRILVANEGEPACTASGAYADPQGSISVIDVAGRRVQAVTFEAFNGEAQELVRNGLRIFGPDATLAQDLEPEHVAVGPLGLRAWVTLQENNAIAIVDLFRSPPAVSAIVPLGFKDHGLPGNALDVSDRDGTDGAALPGNLRTHPNLYGMYLPDGIAAGLINGRTYLSTANEGGRAGLSLLQGGEAGSEAELGPSVVPGR